MNFGISLWILYIFLIHCNFILFAECAPSKDDGAGPSAKTNNLKQEVEKEVKYPTDLLPSSLEWIFSLMEWLAKEWPNLAKEPNIVDGTRIIDKLKETAVGTPQMVKRRNEKEVALDFAVYFREYQMDKIDERKMAREEERKELIQKGTFNPEEWKKEEEAWIKKLIKAKYPNTKEYIFLPILEKVINEVDNTEAEITKGLEIMEMETNPAGENENEKQKRDENDFRFAFMVECIYAAHMDANKKINWTELAKNLHVAYPDVAAHPLHKIVMENKCAKKEFIEEYLTLMLDRFCEVQNPGKGEIDEYFFQILERFRESGKDIKTKNELKEAKEPGKKATAAASLYFPERLPKLHNLASLVNTLIDIVKAIMAKVEPPHSLASEGQIATKMRSNVYAIFTRAIDRLTDIRRFIYFAITKGTHYTEALNQLANSEIKEKMRKIGNEYSFFVSNSNVRPMYIVWDNEKNVHMINYLALNAFGFTQQELPEFPKRVGNCILFCNFGGKIAEKIVEDFYSKLEKDGFRGNKSVAEMNDLLSHQIRLNLFCVGVQEVTTNPQQYKNYDDFQKDFRLHIMDLIKTETNETGYTKEIFNWAIGHVGPYFGHQLTNSEKANKILNEMGKEEHSKVKTWEKIVLEGTKEMHRQICG